MGKRLINGTDLMNMIFSGAQIIQSQVQHINSLNVFPVPDGDTGINMNMTLASGLEMVNKNPSEHLGHTAECLAKGLLMGARGNSGVILSQLFRGFAKSLTGLHQADANQFAAALQQGVATAYEAVVKPIEGTILTVSREAAQYAVMTARRQSDMIVLLKGILNQSKETLSKTPELLPILKQAGVIDSGGQGLVYLYEGFCVALEEGELEGLYRDSSAYSSTTMLQSSNVDTVQAHFETGSIEFPYDMEFFIHIDDEKGTGLPFQLSDFRKKLAVDGDSILVIQDDDIVKVHVHTKKPGDVLNLAISHGELSRFHIENMRDQHRAIIHDDEVYDDQLQSMGKESHSLSEMNSENTKRKGHQSLYGFVAVVIGEGIASIFKSLGVNHIIFGGQTMNPSTEDIVKAIDQVFAETVYVLPNNSNIILAAQQARDLVENKKVMVISTVSIPQGIAAMLAFHSEATVDINKEAMEAAAKEMKSGQVTYAVRDSKFEDIDIKSGDFLGIYDGKIVTATKEMLISSKALLNAMITKDDEMLTVLVGDSVSSEQSTALISFLDEQYPDVEVEMHLGGQPLYSFIFALE